MAGIRDFQCGLDVEKMIELGRYDQEFQVYGFSWYDDARYYYLSGDASSTYRVAFNKMLDGCAVTPVDSLLSRRPVPSGMYQQYNQATKIEMAKRLRVKYSTAFLKKMFELSQVKHSDAGYEPLHVLQNRLEGLFDRDRLDYFRATVDMAYIAKTIDQKQRELFLSWLKKNFKQMEDEIIPEEQYSNIYGGFAYCDSKNSWGLFINADPKIVYKEHQIHRIRKDIVFPIFWKKYWFAKMQQLPLMRERFSEEYATILRDKFGETIQIILDTNSQVLSSYVKKFRNAVVENRGTIEAVNLMFSWWNV